MYENKVDRRQEQRRRSFLGHTIGDQTCFPVWSILLTSHRNTSQHLDAVPGFCLNSQVLVARPPHAVAHHRLQAELGAQLGGRRAPLLVERDKA